MHSRYGLVGCLRPEACRAAPLPTNAPCPCLPAPRSPPPQIEGTVRKEDERRKKKRAEKAARQAEAEEQRRAEVRRLKNLKKAEIEEK